MTAMDLTVDEPGSAATTYELVMMLTIEQGKVRLIEEDFHRLMFDTEGA